MAYTLELHYFGALGDTLETREEQLEVPESVQQVHQLQAFLSARGPKWSTFSQDELLCAVNQAFAKGDHALQTGDEVAFFPPVTGG